MFGSSLSVADTELDHVANATVRGRSASLYNRPARHARLRLPSLATSGSHTVTLRAGSKAVRAQVIHVSGATRRRVR